eukprot:XP_001698823.1 matrix metalloproteinase [Chlamydomonas reinhardtii]
MSEGSLALLAFAALWAALAAAHSAAETITFDGTATVLSALTVHIKDPRCNQRHLGKDYLYVSPVNTSDTALAPVQVAAGPDLQQQLGVATGDLLLNLTLLAPGDTGKEVYNGSTLYVKSITYIISTCGWSESIGADDYHQLCSYGKVVWGPDNNIIVGPVEVPCSGSVQVSASRSAAYNGSSKCGLYEQMAWRTAGEAAARELGYGAWIDAAKQAFGLRVIAVLPAEVPCPWLGLASVGCAGRYCETYIKGTAAADLPSFFHELGHNQGLGHAGAHLDEYGDGSDVMGNAGNGANGYLCLNSAYAYRVGWATPAEQLQVQDTPGGTYLTYTVPATATTDANYLLLNFSASGPGVPPYSYPYPYPNYYVSLRSRTPTYDNILPNKINDQVWVGAAAAKK